MNVFAAAGRIIQWTNLSVLGVVVNPIRCWEIKCVHGNYAVGFSVGAVSHFGQDLWLRKNV